MNMEKGKRIKRYFFFSISVLIKKLKVDETVMLKNIFDLF